MLAELPILQPSRTGLRVLGRVDDPAMNCWAIFGRSLTGPEQCTPNQILFLEREPKRFITREADCSHFGLALWDGGSGGC
jgi:hypothetical protein